MDSSIFMTFAQVLVSVVGEPSAEDHMNLVKFKLHDCTYVC